ncbi:unnamed protein product [Ixodes hexagonus]
MDLSVPSTSATSDSLISCEASNAVSSKALIECIRLRPLFWVAIFTTRVHCSYHNPTSGNGSGLSVVSEEMGLPDPWPPEQDPGARMGGPELLMGAPPQPQHPFSSPAHSTLFTASDELLHDVKAAAAALCDDQSEAHDRLPAPESSLPGVCGLRNLGNTCFMNAGLQCLLSNGQLVRFFLPGGRGHGVGARLGRDSLTARLASLVGQVWSGAYACLRPALFKEALGASCPQFRDCRQHDCQEFLTLLLDTLHEQTNRAGRTSPGVEDSDSPQGSDSAGSWDSGLAFRPRPFPEEVQPLCESKYSEAEESAVVVETAVGGDSPATTAAVAVAAIGRRRMLPSLEDLAKDSKGPSLVARAPEEGVTPSPREGGRTLRGGGGGAMVRTRGASPSGGSSPKRPRLSSCSPWDSHRQGLLGGAREELCAQQAWAQYAARNQSVVVDTFQGQFQSTVVCSECGHVSVTYEPFMYLPVPLPHAMERQIVVTYVPLGAGVPTRHLVRVPKQERVSRLTQALEEMMDEKPPHGVALAEVADSLVHRVLDGDMAVRCVGDNNRAVYAFALGPPEDPPPPSSPCAGGEGEGPGASKAAEPALGLPAHRAWHSCAICLEDMADDHLHMHPSCRCLLCRNCVEISCKHYGSDSLICPVCNLPVKAEDEFIPVTRMSDHKFRSRPVTVALLFCQEGSAPWRLPALLRVACHSQAGDLYAAAGAHLPPGACYWLCLVDSSGRRCSRCPGRCPGCEVARAGEVCLQPGDCLALRRPPEEAPSSSQEGEQAPPPTTPPTVLDHPSMGMRRPSGEGGALTLYDCLRAFSESETLDEQNPWFCPTCCGNQRARKTLSVWRSPDTLMVYLKRRVFCTFYSGSKVDDRVEFPLEGLDLGPFVSGPCPGGSCLYDLHAYICHFGGVNCGHYTAYTRHWTSGEWYHYNDEAACKQAPRQEDHANAYILFYQRRGTGSLSGFPAGGGGGTKGCCIPADQCPRSPDDGSSARLEPDTVQRAPCQTEERKGSSSSRKGGSLPLMLACLLSFFCRGFRCCYSGCCCDTLGL